MDYSALLEIQDPRQMLKKALEIQYQKKGRINFADFARKCGFLSRGFVPEYISGRRGLSRDSLRALAKGMRVSGPYKKLFELAVLIDQPALAGGVRSVQSSLAKFKILRSELSVSEAERPMRLRAFSLSTPELLQVYAALGAKKTGASVEEIIRRSKLSDETVVVALKRLIDSGVVQKVEDRYFSSSAALDLSGPAYAVTLANLTVEATSSIQKDAKRIAEKLLTPLEVL